MAPPPEMMAEQDRPQSLPTELPAPLAPSDSFLPLLVLRLAAGPSPPALGRGA